MRAGLLLPVCLILSALAHMLLVAAVAVPRKGVTSHGEAVNVDIVPASEIPDLPEVPESPAESLPAQQAEQAAPPPDSASEIAEKRKQPAERQTQPRKQPAAQQAPPQRQAAPQQPSPSPQQPQEQQAAQQPVPDQPTPAAPAPGSTLAEQHARLSAMLNLAGPDTGDGSGAEADTKARLTQNDITAFRNHLKSCWRLPAGVPANHHLKVVVRMSLNPNGSLASDPQLIEAGISPQGPPLVRAAVEAIKKCQPYSMLPAEKYREWRILDINFSPDEMAKS